MEDKGEKSKDRKVGGGRWDCKAECKQQRLILDHFRKTDQLLPHVAETRDGERSKGSRTKNPNVSR